MRNKTVLTGIGVLCVRFFAVARKLDQDHERRRSATLRLESPRTLGYNLLQFATIVVVIYSSCVRVSTAVLFVCLFACFYLFDTGFVCIRIRCPESNLVFAGSYVRCEPSSSVNNE